MKKWALKRSDRLHLKETLTRTDAITVSPSTLKDISDFDLIRSSTSAGKVTIRALLDNNIVTRILKAPTENSRSNSKQTDQHFDAYSLMGYFLYTGIETIPNLAMYESDSTPSPEERITADQKFRILDHLPASEFLDLARRRTPAIRQSAWLTAKAAVISNQLTQADIASHQYQGQLHTQMYFSANIMKAWLILKSDTPNDEALDQLLSWTFEDSITDQTTTIFCSLLLSKSPLGKMIKNINSTQPEVIIKSIKNAAWDLAQIHAFLFMASHSKPNQIVMFCSRDRLCHEFTRISLGIKREEQLLAFAMSKFSKKQAKALISHNSRHNKRVNRKAHVEAAHKRMPATVASLEEEITRCLA